MGRLLDKINAERDCGFADLWKTSNDAASGVRNCCGLLRETKASPQNLQLLRTLKTSPNIAFRKSENPQGVHAENQSSLQTRLNESALQAFVELVRGFGAVKHQILLHRDEIEGQLDADDIQELLENDRAYRQDWAELLAYRLCMARLRCSDSEV